MKDYFGEPDYIDTIGYIYPIGISEWSEFSSLAYKYFMFSNDFIKYKLKITDGSLRVFDYLFLMMIANEDVQVRTTILSELEKLLSLILKEDVKGYISKNKHEYFFMIGDSDKKINRDNFDAFKQIVLRQNLMFEPIFAPNEHSQKYIDKAIAVLSRGNTSVDIEAMLVYVSNAKKLHPSELKNYTYYQLRADCEMEMRKEANRDTNLFRSQGCDVSSVNLLEELSIHKNPYGKDALFIKVNKGKDSQLENMMKN